MAIYGIKKGLTGKLTTDLSKTVPSAVIQKENGGFESVTPVFALVRHTSMGSHVVEQSVSFHQGKST